MLRYNENRAGMAELADALDLGSSAARRAGSSPVPGTSNEIPRSARDFASRLPLRSRLLTGQVQVLFPAASP